MKKPKIVVLGAGPAGLGAAWRLRQLGHREYAVFEQSNHVGGLATSYVDPQGFTWDVGGHVLHSHYPYFDAVFNEVMEGEYFTHQRESWIWIYDRFVPYPFQNNIHRLPPAVMKECLDGLKALAHETHKPPENFADWIRASFGKGIAKHFLLPYNRKVWAYPPEKMNYRWVGDRVAVVDVGRIETNIGLNRDDVSWGPNATFQFPKHGGTGEIWRRVGGRLADRITLEKKAVHVDAKKRVVHFSDGSHEGYDLLFSSMPLDTLARMLSDLDELADVTPLHHSTVTIVGIGMRGQVPENLQTKCWMYFPEDKAPFFRATVFSNYSQFNAPEGAWSLMTETASSRSVPLPKGDIEKLVLQGARRTRLIPADAKIESVWTFRADYGYPTPTLGRDAILERTLPALAKRGIYSRGRFGAWKYEVSNQDHTFMQGVEWVNSVLGDEPELTVNDPRAANAPKLA